MFGNENVSPRWAVRIDLANTRGETFYVFLIEFSTAKTSLGAPNLRGVPASVRDPLTAS
jgi:hypothetical protein